MRDMDDQCLFYSWNMERDMRLKENDGGRSDEGDQEIGDKVDIELADPRQMGIVTLGELREHPRIVKFKKISLKKLVFMLFQSYSSQRNTQCRSAEVFKPIREQCK